MNPLDLMTADERFRYTQGYTPEYPRPNKPARVDDDELSELHWLIRERYRELGEPEPIDFLERLRRAEEELEAVRAEAEDLLAVKGRPTSARPDYHAELLAWEEEAESEYYEKLRGRL